MSAPSISTYTLVKDDIGHKIRCDISSKDNWVLGLLQGKLNDTVQKADPPAAPTELTAAQMTSFTYRALHSGEDRALSSENDSWYEESAEWITGNGYWDGIDFAIDNETAYPRYAVVMALYNTRAAFLVVAFRTME